MIPFMIDAFLREHGLAYDGCKTADALRWGKAYQNSLPGHS